jgi:hypothetical protein
MNASKDAPFIPGMCSIAQSCSSRSSNGATRYRVKSLPKVALSK